MTRKQRHRQTKDQDLVSFWKKILLAIPKNLVYIFVCIVFFAFAAMCYITYTEHDLVQFLRYNHSKEVVVVDPLFTSLKESMIDELDIIKPMEVPATAFTAKIFFDHFLSESRPVVVRQYAANWAATTEWADKEYLSS